VSCLVKGILNHQSCRKVPYWSLAYCYYFIDLKVSQTEFKGNMRIFSCNMKLRESPTKYKLSALKKKLGENDLSGEATCKHLDCRVAGNVHQDESSVHLRDPQAILLIKQLQEKCIYYFLYLQLERLVK
ncbi:unnamed protein product, partial [Brassica oleracea]